MLWISYWIHEYTEELNTNIHIYTYKCTRAHTTNITNYNYSYSLYMANFIYIAVAPSIHRKLLIMHMIYYIATACHMLQ